MATTLQLTFLTQGGSRASISLDNPKPTLAQADVVTAMDDIITKNIFNTSAGDLVSKHSAQVIDRTATVLYTIAI